MLFKDNVTSEAAKDVDEIFPSSNIATFLAENQMER